MIRRKHILHDDNFETIGGIFFIPIKLSLLVLFSQHFVNLVDFLRVTRFVLLIFLVELCSFDFNLKSRLNLSFVEHFECDRDALLFGVGNGCVSLWNSRIITIYFDFFFSCLQVDSNDACLRGKLFQLFFVYVWRQTTNVDEGVNFRVVPFLFFLFGSLN